MGAGAGRRRGVGLAAVDVAIALGARVIAAASSPEKLEAATPAGADATIAYEKEDLKQRAREIAAAASTWSSTRWADGTVSPPCGPPPPGAVLCDRVRHRPIASVPLNQVLLNNRTVVGVDWAGGRSMTRLATVSCSDQITAMLADGRLHPASPVLPLAEAASVMEGLLERAMAGKAVLEPVAVTISHSRKKAPAARVAGSGRPG